MQHLLVGIYNPDEYLISPTFTRSVSIVLVNAGDSTHVKESSKIYVTTRRICLLFRKNWAL